MRRTSFEGLPPHGELVRGDIYLPEGPEAMPPASAVIVVHGFKGFKDWGFFPHVCREIARDGHAVVAFNFSRNGVGSEMEDFTELERFGRNTFSHEMEDLHWIIARVQDGELLGGRPRRIGILGHSRGGGAGILAARELAGPAASPDHEAADLGALVTWAAVATLDRWDEATKREWREKGRLHVLNGRTGQQMPLDLTLLEDFEAHRERFDVTAAAREVKAPWLIVHGTEDAAVSVGDANALAGANERATLSLVEGAGHTFETGHPFQGASPELEQVVRDTRAHFRRELLETGSS